MIDLLLERYLKTIKYDLIPGLENQVDVFVNPSRKERNEIFNDEDNYGKAMRFILDQKTKKVYGFSANYLHKEVWTHIGDGRKMYTDDSLLGGVLEKSGEVKFESSFHYWQTVWDRIMADDWTWAERHIKGLNKQLEREK